MQKLCNPCMRRAGDSGGSEPPLFAKNHWRNGFFRCEFTQNGYDFQLCLFMTENLWPFLSHDRIIGVCIGSDQRAGLGLQMDKAKLILIIDDDEHIREVVRFALQTAGFQTVEAAGGMEALSLFEEARPDLLVLDIVMPGMDGTEVCRKIRSCSPVPIVFLSSRDEEIDRIVGLELGGDDYVTKPFSPRELVARVKAILRRTADSAQEPVSLPGEGSDRKSVEHGLLRIDPDRFEAYWGERKVVLTVTEFNIILTMLGYPGKVFTRDELMTGAYAFDNVVTDRTIDSHVRRVRKKFAEVGGDPIETVHGLGYKLGTCLGME